MNFLAHIYLSGQNKELMVGNFIGDFVKGNALKNFPEQIRDGIVLHREIDRFTDENQVVLKSKKRLRPKYHHYSPVIVDVFYDHFLAKRWEHYSEIPLRAFITAFYDTITLYDEILPEKARNILVYMKRDNWLYNYQYLEGVNRALTGMARRTPFRSNMEKATTDLEAHYDTFQDEFITFFPKLESHVSGFINSFNQ